MTSGVLEIVGNGAAFLRQREAGYLASKTDVFSDSGGTQRTLYLWITDGKVRE